MQLWKEVQPGEKAPFESQAAALKVKYDEDMAEYRRTHPDAGAKKQKSTAATDSSKVMNP